MNITALKPLDQQDAVEAWRLSRDREATYAEETVLSVEASVNELPSALLHFEDLTILEREIFTTLRNHVIWARTSRVDDPLTFTVPTELHVPFHEQCRALMRQHTGQQDEWRMHLPIMAHTSWVARISLRDLVNVANYFNYLASLTDIHNDLRKRFHAVSVALFEHAPTSAHDYKLKKLLHEGLPEFQPAHKRVGNVEFFCGVVPFALRAQIVRHRGILIQDNLFAILREGETTLGTTLASPMCVHLCATTQTWTEVLSHRACWIAQQDLWQPITKCFPAVTLPCADGICPYEADAEARLRPGNDPNPPCPRYMNLHHLDKAPWRERMLAHNSNPQWLQEINA